MIRKTKNKICTKFIVIIKKRSFASKIILKKKFKLSEDKKIEFTDV